MALKIDCFPCFLPFTTLLKQVLVLFKSKIRRSFSCLRRAPTTMRKWTASSLLKMSWSFHSEWSTNARGCCLSKRSAISSICFIKAIDHTLGYTPPHTHTGRRFQQEQRLHCLIYRLPVTDSISLRSYITGLVNYHRSGLLGAMFKNLDI